MNNNYTYIVTTYTADRISASTKADVYIELIGTKDRTGLLALASNKSSNPFGRGKTSSFDLKTDIDIGTRVKIRIGHNNKGFSANWYLEYVKIETKNDGIIWFCECNKWLSKVKGDKKIERELFAYELDKINNVNTNVDIIKKDTRRKSDCESDNNSSSDDNDHKKDHTVNGHNKNDDAKDHTHDEHDEHDHEHEHDEHDHHESIKPSIWIYKDAQNLGNFFICLNDNDTKNWLEFHPNQKLKEINSYKLVKMDKIQMSVVLRSKSKSNYIVRLSKNKIEFGESVSELKEFIRNSQQSLIGDWACFQSCTTLVQGSFLWIYDDVEMGFRNSFFVYLPTYGEWIEIINGSIYDKYTQVHGLTAGIKNNDEVVLKSDSRDSLFVKLSAICMHWSESDKDFEAFKGYCGHWVLNFSDSERNSIRLRRLY